MVGSVRVLGLVEGWTICENGPYVTCSCGRWPSYADSPDLEAMEHELPSSCEHTWTAVKEGLDVAPTEHDSPPMCLPRVVYVPLIHKHPQFGMFIAVRNEMRVREMTPFFFWTEPLPELAKSMSLYRHLNYPIGYLDAGEGRWAMRAPILEWLRGLYYELPPCNFKYHTDPLFSKLDRKCRDADSRSPAVLWSVLHMIKTGGTCPACADAVTDTVDDLVPDV